MSKLLSTIIVLTALALNAGADDVRSLRTINDGWSFRMPEEKAWHAVNIPHTYNLDAYQGRHYYQGRAHYQRRLDVKPRDGRRYYLKVDAASKAAEVRIDGQTVARHNGGYTAFVTDLTGRIGQGSVLEVTVDNARKDITPVSADFTFWGGIYRDVWIVETAQQHFNMMNHGSKGIFITTPSVSEERAVAEVRAEVTNDDVKPVTVELLHTIFSPDGKDLGTIRKRIRLKSGETASATMSAKPVERPELWSPESPRLYEVRSRIVDTRTGGVLDEVVQPLAFRWFAFDGERGFTLNGKPYKLRGCNRHQDQAPLGVALDDEAHRRDFRMMKEIGCNFIRISHYPQDDALLEMCDREGMLVWEEIPIVNYVPKTEGYADNCEYNLREMIRQHHNHPSVIAWGYMNEILLHSPNPSSKEWPEARERTVTLARRLEKVLKEEDSARASVMAFNMTNLYNEIGLDLEDVAGWNLYHGWYVGKLPDFNAFCEDQHRRYPKHPIIISEWGAGSDRRLHSDNARPFDFSIEYQQTYIEHYLPFIEQTQWISGCAYWNFIDFNVAARQESMPRVNNKGLFYNDRTPKDVAYYFKAMWRKDIPVVHIASRDRPLRTGSDRDWHTIKVYSNMKEVELLVNGMAIGRKTVENCHATFSVTLPYGNSIITAKGIDGSRVCPDVCTVTLQPLPDMERNGELAVNVGSNCSFTSDVTGLTWLADKAYTSDGKWGHRKGAGRSTTTEIGGTADGPLYQTWLEGDEVEYRVDCPDGTYEVELLTADVSKGAAPALPNLLGRKDDAASAAKGSRFSVTLCGEMVEEDFTPAPDGHYCMASKRRYITAARDGGGITVTLKAVSGKASLAGIKVRRMTRQ